MLLMVNHFAGATTGRGTGVVGDPLIPIRVKVKAITADLKAFAIVSGAFSGAEDIEAGTEASIPSIIACPAAIVGIVAAAVGKVFISTEETVHKEGALTSPGVTIPAVQAADQAPASLGIQSGAGVGTRADA
jgi:hypothetical protein